MTTDTIIEVNDLYKSYGTQPILQGISFQMQKGEMVAITGRSGSGKSTLLHIVGGIDRDYQGMVRSCGNELAKLSDTELSHFRNKSLGFVFQAFHLLDHLSCLENVTLPNAFAGQPLSKEEAGKRAEEVLDRVGLSEFKNVRPAELSGGQKQRVAIARALFHHPILLLCDEPTGNLDSLTALQMIELFRSLNQDGITLLVVTHDVRIPAVAHRVLQMSDGRIIL